MIVGLISSYDEGPLLLSALRSLSDAGIPAVVFEGPTDPGQPSSPPARTPRNIVYVHDRWPSDAAKRTAMVTWVQRWRPNLRWGLWLDADEILLYGEYLADHLRWIEQRDTDERVGFKFPIRLVELDGSVAVCHGKVVRIDQVRAYHRSTTDVEFKWSLVVQVLGNVPVWHPAVVDGEGRIVEQQDAQTAENRPPLAGEPHLLHRSALRRPERAGLRLHTAEAAEWQALKERSGLGGLVE